MKLELFSTEGCASCTASRGDLQAAAFSAIPGLVWRDVNPLNEMDYAVELGVAALPSVAINGKLVFTFLPTADQLRKALLAIEQGVPDGR